MKILTVELGDEFPEGAKTAIQQRVFELLSDLPYVATVHSRYDGRELVDQITIYHHEAASRLLDGVSAAREAGE